MMAKMNDVFGFTGPLGNVSVYKMKGVNGLIMRTKGGPSKRQVKHGKKFVRTRENNAEFGGRATASKYLMAGLGHQKRVADYNIAGPLNALMKPIQALDTENDRGQRNIILSKNPRILEGFSLNRNHPFDNIVRQPFTWTLVRGEQSGAIHMPPLVQDINLHPYGNWPLFCLVTTIAILPDLYHTPYGYKPSLDSTAFKGSVRVDSDWHFVKTGSPAIDLSIKFPQPPPDEAYSVMLTVGIRFGMLQPGGAIEETPFAGAAKVLAMA